MRASRRTSARRACRTSIAPGRARLEVHGFNGAPAARSARAGKLALPWGEARRLRLEAHEYGADGAVTLLADDDLGEAPRFRVGVVVVLAVEHEHDVRVVLDVAGLAQVREQRPAIGPALDPAVDLRAHHDRHLELLGDRLQAPGEASDLLGAVLALAGHELQVVDHDQAEPELALDATRSQPHMDERSRWRLVDVDFQAREMRVGLGQPHLALVVSQSALAELLAAHFEREVGDRVMPADVLRYLLHERRLAHARAPGDDHELPGAKPPGFQHLVEGREAGRHRPHRGIARVHGLGNGLAQAYLVGAAGRLQDLEEGRLRFLGELDGHGPRLLRAVVELHAPRLYLAPQVGIAHHFRVSADVGRAHRIAGELAEVLISADFRELAGAIQALGDGQIIGRLAVLDELAQRLEDQPVPLLVEVLRAQELDAIIGVRPKQQRP